MANALEINNLLFKWHNEDNFLLKIKKLSIENNSKVIMFGESGSGKSTLLNLISGILSPNSGTIIVKNKFDFMLWIRLKNNVKSVRAREFKFPRICLMKKRVPEYREMKFPRVFWHAVVWNQ